MIIDVTPLLNAAARLREGLERHRREPDDAQLRDGLIQRFEFTYEIAHKTLRRVLKETAANPAEVDAMAFADLIRSGSRQGLLLGDWPAWRTYRDMRARTSHAYDEAVAAEVVKGVGAFLDEAEFLAARLRERLP